MTKTIFITGSGRSPDIKPPDNALIYASNSSLSRISSKYDSQIVHVASINMFDRKIIGKTPHLLKRQMALVNRAPRELFLSPPFHTYDMTDWNLEKMGYQFKCMHTMNRLEFWWLIYRIAGVRPWLQGLKYDEGHATNIARLVLHALGRPISPNFRPSTGVIALLLAISRHGKRVTYYVDGVDDRTINNNNEKIRDKNVKFCYVGEVFEFEREDGYGGHRFDKLILDLICCQYRVIFNSNAFV